MTDQIKEALVLLGYFVEEPESVTVAHEADKQYDELLAYVDKLENYVLTTFELRRLTEVWIRKNKPEWLHRDAVSVDPQYAKSLEDDAIREAYEEGE